MANLLVEIGNTALKAAWADGITLGKTFRYQGEKTMDFILSVTAKQKPDVMVVCSGTEISGQDMDILRAECGELVIMDPAHKDVSQRNSLPGFLSGDRAASIIAVRYLFKGKPSTIVDFGTTLTVDFISSDGLYQSGNISLGCRTRFKALGRYSRSLPVLNFPEEPPVTGTTVETSIEAGVVTGIVFEINGYLSLSPDNIVVFTGGDANYFAKRMKNSIFVICNLVSMGLAIIAGQYGKR